MAAQSAQSRPNGSQSTTTHRYSSSHTNSSAFSASANPNEDWTKISDLAERRRIQNRIAQRNYRKKLKKRLEDLERRASSTSASPEPEPRQSPYTSQGQYQPRPTPSVAPTSSVRFPSLTDMTSSYDYPPRPSQRKSSFPDPPDDSLMSHSTPTFSYSSYGNSETVGSSYPHSPTLSSYSLPSPSHSGHYLSPRIASDSPHTSPFESAAGKQEYFDHEFGAYSMGYGAADLHSYHQDSVYHQHTPPLSEAGFDSFDNSVMGSPPDMWALFPTPPPESPPFLQL